MDHRSQKWPRHDKRREGNSFSKINKSEGVDATFLMTDDDFEQVCLGKLQPQTAFMKGQMKIKGNMKKAYFFDLNKLVPCLPLNCSHLPLQKTLPNTTVLSSDILRYIQSKHYIDSKLSG